MGTKPRRIGAGMLAWLGRCEWSIWVRQSCRATWSKRDQEARACSSDATNESSSSGNSAALLRSSIAALIAATKRVWWTPLSRHRYGG